MKTLGESTRFSDPLSGSINMFNLHQGLRIYIYIYVCIYICIFTVCIYIFQ